MEFSSNISSFSRSMRRVCLAATILMPLPAFAQTPVSSVAEPSESAMVNLVRALVSQGALKAEVGAALVKQAEAEAAQALAAKQQVASNELPPAANGAIRVPYIPESVRTQIKDELRADVMKQAREARWASPGEAAPEWTRRITLHGDVRVRSQSELYSRTNSNEIIDFATINALSPYGIDDPRLLLPILNARNDRWNNLRFRARLGVDAKLAEGVSAGIAIATGDNDGPISTNSSLAGGFSKRDLWLDKAWINIAPTTWSNLTLGRFDNPFSSSDLLYDPDVNLDGIAAEINTGGILGENLNIAARGGGFPLSFGSSNTPVFEFDKIKTPQKYLFAGELEATGKFSGVDFKIGAGYHSFRNLQGQLSEPCQVETDSFCSTDFLQPFFLTKGNTLSPLRQIVTVNPNADLPQILGYTFKYNILDVNAAVGIQIMDTMGIHLSGSYVKNLGFDQADICRNGVLGRPYNNNAAGGGTFCTAVDPAAFAGGDTGYRFEALLGRKELNKAGEWNVLAGYRYLESDAVLDAFADSDFHLGGTNAKGYFIGGHYEFYDGVSFGARWMSSNEISGPPLSIDVLQVDLVAKF
jgi:Putative porin